MSRDGHKKRDGRVRIPLDPEEALRALLAVDPDAEPDDDQDQDEHNVDEPKRG